MVTAPKRQVFDHCASGISGFHMQSLSCMSMHDSVLLAHYVVFGTHSFLEMSFSRLST